ncbi:hypothetical protein OEW28_07375 [Defluviimonas sp. WL0002]|uniref:Uncharacterized protein n=1 Tax=Albidovulum marisflavi TaxID=2984159 RepID=A0ABT2ZBP9_9RHOB|nr:hypothetical protein [Defluviimonas sp. WL0002]MCV2868447.1 hypothetical protein [Defluviimonas sp. WL0002]
MSKTPQFPTYGQGFSHMETRETFRDFIAWWNERSHFPFDAMEEKRQDWPMAA